MLDDISISREQLRSLVAALNPQSDELAANPNPGAWLVTATAPVNQILDFHLSVNQKFPESRLFYLGSKSRIDDIQELLKLPDSNCIRSHSPGALSTDSIEALETVLARESFAANVALINNVSGIGYGNVLESLFATGAEVVFTCNIRLQFIRWTRDEWVKRKLCQDSLDELLQKAYVKMLEPSS